MNKNQFNIKTLARPNVLELTPYSSARDEFKDINAEMVYLDANENPNENGLNRYPDPQQLSVKELLAVEKSMNVDQILLGNGSDEILDLIIRAFCEPNQDNVILLPPTYGMYQVLAEVNSVEIKRVLLSEDFEPKVDEILATSNKNTKLLFICSPNNPTANSFKRSKIENLIDKFNGIVVIDEAYIDFSTEESYISKLKDFPNLIVTQTLSKAYGMAGIRLGMCYASKEIISILNRIKPPYNVNQLTQQKALERIRNIDRVRLDVVEILNERKKLEVELKNIDFISQVFDSDANFILARVDDADRRYTELKNTGVIVRNRSRQPLCENCLRFTVGTKVENKILIEALRRMDVA